jgi:acyl-CoA reductase-like NAD-dependent aldehyde dehydrogenase
MSVDAPRPSYHRRQAHRRQQRRDLTRSSPGDGEKIGHAPDADATDLDAAIGAARRAFDETTWSEDPASASTACASCTGRWSRSGTR